SIFLEWAGSEEVIPLCRQYLASLKVIVADGQVRNLLTWRTSLPRSQPPPPSSAWRPLPPRKSGISPSRISMNTSTPLSSSSTTKRLCFSPHRKFSIARRAAKVFIAENFLLRGDGVHHPHGGRQTL